MVHITQDLGHMTSTRYHQRATHWQTEHALCISVAVATLSTLQTRSNQWLGNVKLHLAKKPCSSDFTPVFIGKTVHI